MKRIYIVFDGFYPMIMRDRFFEKVDTLEEATHFQSKEEAKDLAESYGPKIFEVREMFKY